MIRFLSILAALALLWPTAAGAQAARTERIEAELVSMTQWATPGGGVVLAVRQSIAPGWHTYWRNPGDSGGATTLTWSAPEGVRPGEILWPTPERQTIAGIASFVYEGVVYLPVPVEIPASARPGTSLPIRVKALFLVCNPETCVPDELDLALDLPVREGEAPLDAEHGAAIQTVLEQAPRPAGIQAHATLNNGVVTLTATGGPLAGQDPGPSFFFPYGGGVIDHTAAQSGSRGPQGLTLILAAGGATAAKGRLAGPMSGVLVTDRGAWEITAEPGEPLPGATGAGQLEPRSDGSGEAPAAATTPATPATFLQAALFALLGGLILNLMPCVFPILAMKAASLTASAHDPRQARRDGLAFMAGVLVAFVVLAGALLGLRAAGEAVGWGFQLQSPPVTATLALLMLAVALNLSGVFEVGARLQTLGAAAPERKGSAGAFLTGVLAVAVAAPCTAPFMAFALGAALVMPWPMALMVFLMLGLGLALPFTAISLSPALLARLPRPGPWMGRLKGLLAFPMYGTALWLAWVFGRQTDSDALGLLFVGGLSLALGLWLIGGAQTARMAGRDGRPGLIGAFATLLLALAALVVAARTPVTTAAPGAAPANGDAPASQPWSQAAVDAALAEGRPVLVNFTADWCVTCKINERTSLATAGVREAVARTNAVYLVGDWTRRDDAITAELQRHGRSGVPLYLAYSPGSSEPRILPQLLTEGVVVEALDGARPNP